MLNMVALTGRLTYEPELKSTDTGTAVIRFQVACDRNYQAKGRERLTDFIDCVAWRGTAEFVNRYFHKGSMIAVEGSIQTQNYTDSDGIRRKAVEVYVTNVSFCGSRTRLEEPAAADNSTYEEIVTADPAADDDLPF